jgi:hypothetical protein
MHASIRLLASLVFVTGGLGGVAVVRPTAIRTLGLEWEGAPRSDRGLVRPAEEASIIRINRMRAKDRIIDQMLAGQLGLFEAAAWFQAINETPVEFPDRSFQKLPGRSSGEQVCRQLIGWYRAVAEQRMPRSQLDAQVKILDEELESRIAKNGTVILPRP